MWCPSYSPCQQKWWTSPHPWSLSLLRTPLSHSVVILWPVINFTCYYPSYIGVSDRKREHFRYQSLFHPYPTSLTFVAVILCGSASHYFRLCSWWTPDKTPIRARGGKNVISNSEWVYICHFPRGDSWGEETKSDPLALLKNTPSCCRLSKSRNPSAPFHATFHTHACLVNCLL